MNIVIKISDDYTAATTTAQIINPDDLRFIDELVNSGSLSFRIPLSSVHIGSIIEFKKVALYAIEGGKDHLLWSGYIDVIENDFTDAFVRCGDEKDFLRNKIIFGNKNWAATNISTAISSILTEANSRKGPTEGLLTLETELTSNVGKQFTQGTTYFDILSELSDALNFEWSVRFNKIYIKTTIGTDRTVAGLDYFQFIWNKNSPNENSILSFKNTRNSREIATHVIGKGGAGISIIAGDKSIYGSIERSISMDQGNIATQTQEYINSHQVSQIERDFNTIIDDEMARKIQIGDLVSVRIIHDSALVDTIASLKVIQKDFIFENKRPTIIFKLATLRKEVANAANFLAELNRRVKRIELS